MMRASLVLIAITGCYDPSIREGAPCSVTTDCPAPQVCDLGMCRLTTSPRDSASDGSDAATLPDALVDAPPAACTPPGPLGDFSDPVVVLTLQSVGDDGTPSVTSDHLELYFKSERALGGQGQADIWRTTRASTSAAWSAPTNVTELNSPASDGSPELSPDRLTIYLSSSRPGGLGGFDIWRSTRATTSSTWSAPVNVPELSSSSYEEGFTMLPSGRIGYLHSQRGGGTNRLYRTTRTSQTAAWSVPVVVHELVSLDEENPAVMADDCAIYFQSLRAGTGDL